MADVLCPMCGKANPAELDNCQYCQAKLPHTQQQASNEDAPDWLSNLRAGAPDLGASDEQAAAESGAGEPAAQSDEPEWLARIRQKNQDSSFDEGRHVAEASQDAQAAQTPQNEDELPEWLNAPDDSGVPNTGSLEAWLKQLHEVDPVKQAPESPAAPPAKPQAAAARSSDEEMQAWMRSMQSWQPAQSISYDETVSQPPAAEPVTPPESQPVEEPPAAEPVIPQEQLPADQAEPGAELPPAEPAGEMPAEEQPPAEGIVEPAEFPDWLTSLAAGELPAETAPAEQGEPADWLSRLAEQPGADVTPAPAPAEMAAEEQAGEPAAPQDESFSGWLERMQSASATAAPETPAGEAATPEPQAGAVFEEPAAGPVEELPAQPAETPAGELPDWLQEMQAPAEQAAPVAPEAQAEPAAFEAETPSQPAETPAGELPDWLQEMQAPAEQVAPAAPEARAEAAAFEAELPAQPAETPAGELPDWLQQMQAPAEHAAPAAPETQPEPAAFEAETPSQPAETPAGELPDWLQEMQAPAEQAAPEAQAEPAAFEAELPTQPAETPAGELPDWLQEMQAPAEQAAPAAPEAQAEPAAFEAELPTQPAEPQAEGLPDWLQEMQAAQEPPAPAVPEGQPEAAAFEAELPAQPVEPQAEGLPDWLQEMQAQEGQAAPPAAPQEIPAFEGELPAQPAEPQAEGGELPDWLVQMQAGQEPAAPAPAEAEQAAAAVEGELPDWLSSAAPAQQPAQPAIPQAEELPDWLSEMKSEQETAAPASPAPPAAEPSEEAPAVPAEMPDWLSRLPSQQGPAAPATPAFPEEGEPSKPRTTGWLTGALSAEQAGLSEGPSLEETGDWLSRLPSQAESATPSTPAFPEESEPPRPRTTGWLTGALSAEQAGLTAEPPAEQPAEPQAETPDWLSRIGGQPPAAPPATPAPAAPTPAQPAQGDEPLPDWLKEFEKPPTPENWVAAGSEGLPEGEEEAQYQQAEPAAPAEPAQVPDWLSGITPPSEATTPAESGQGAFATPFEQASLTSETSNWLSNIQPPTTPSEAPATPAFVFDEGPSATTQGASGTPFAADNIPNWLSQMPQSEEAAPAEPTAGEAEAAEPSSEGLEPAQLPGWLQAMRPVEAVMPGAAVSMDDQRVETAGPLAGLKGILPTDDQVIQYRKPPSYSIKLRVSEKQRIHATMLENVLAQESHRQVSAPEKGGFSQRIVRIVIGLVLIAALLYPIFTIGDRLAPPNLPATAAIQSFKSSMDALPADSVVLVAVDFDPGFSGEMRFVAGSVLQQLMEKKARLAFVSSVPAGPVLAEQLLSDALKVRPELAQGYDQTGTADHVINLGYLPGGVASLQEFALSPRAATVFGFNYSASPWGQGFLQPINTIANFNQVVVLTDSVDTGRAWIEQAQPLLGNTPMLLATSAQAAPMLKPYVESGQVKGMLAGLLDSTTYHQYLQNQTSGSIYLDAYQAGVILAVCLIVIGMLIQGVRYLLSLRKVQKGT